MKIALSLPFAGVCLCVLLAAPAARSEEIALRPRFRPGDSYGLSLSVSTHTEAIASGEGGESFEENVRLHYRASVVVLEVNEEGRPVRERHDGVSLTYERPGGSGSLFKEGVGYEVERTDRIALGVGDRRLDAKLEDTVADVLAKQFEYTLEPALVEPRHAVEAGDSWPLDESLARRFLQSRGVRVLEFGEAPMATLQRDGEDGGWVIEYRIPIARFELTRMPPEAEASRSEARLDGQIRVPSDPRRAPSSASSSLTLRMSGVSAGPEQRTPWSVRSTVIVEKSSTRAPDLAASDAPTR